MRRFLQACWQGTRFCGQCVLSFGIWSVWLLLLIVLGVQIYIATAHELAVPRFVLRELSSRLSASGLRLEFERAQFDPSGRIFVEGVSLVAETFNEPLLTADHVYVRLDPLDLLVRDIVLTEVRAGGVNLNVPAMLSPSGRGESVVSGLHATLRFREDDPTFDLVDASARFANLELTATGALTMPVSRPRELPVLDEIVRQYLTLIRKAAEIAPQLEVLREPRLDLVFTPDADRLAVLSLRLQAEEAAVAAGRWGLPGELQVTRPRLRTSFALAGVGPVPLVLDASTEAVRLADRFEATTVRVRAAGLASPDATGFSADQVEAAAASVSARGFTTTPVAVLLRPTTEGRWAAHAVAGVHEASWTLDADVNPATRAGTVRAAGVLPRPLFEQFALLADRRLLDLVQYNGTPSLEAAIDLAPGGRPQRVSGSLRTGPVVARNVPLEAVRARFAWEGTSVAVDEIELRTGTSLAHGSYTMDTKSRDFRFLLKGSLQPSDINGWFRDWWPRFWNTFDFSRELPRADVDVAGRWGVPFATTVYVGAEGNQAGLRGVVLDKVYTQLFIRPGFVDGLYFHALKDGRTAKGTFTRRQDLAARALATLDFDVETNLPPEDASRLAGPEVVELAKPYGFTAPPELKVAGRLSGPASPDGARADLTIEGRTDAPVTFYDFPLSRLSFRAIVAGERILVQDIVAGFAEGEMKGEADLNGPGPARRLTFDARLEGATVGQAIRTVEVYTALRAGVVASPESRFQQRIASGRLDLALSAKGLSNDIRSFQGSGNARISDANLGEVNLLGVLSTLLRRTLLNYSTLQLDTAEASFALAGPTLVFPLVRISGPRAALDASGNYNFDTKSVDFAAKVFPFEGSRSLLGTAIGTMLAPLSSVLEVNLTGRLDNPSWVFVYGPTSFFRALTGSENSSEPEPPPPVAPMAPPPPSG